MPDGPARRMHRPPRVRSGTVPLAKELPTFSDVAVYPGDSRPWGPTWCVTRAACSASGLCKLAGKIDVLLSVLGRLDGPPAAGLLDGAVDSGEPEEFGPEVDRSEGNELTPSQSGSVLQAHGHGPGSFSLLSKDVEEGAALVVVGEVVLRDEADGLTLMEGASGVPDLPHRVSLSREPPSLVGVRHQRSKAGPETLEGCWRKALTGKRQDLLAHRRRPVADGHVCEPGEYPVPEEGGLPLLVAHRAPLKMDEVVVCEGGHGSGPVRRGAQGGESGSLGRTRLPAPCGGSPPRSRT